jgi:hypothetical protein
MSDATMIHVGLDASCAPTGRHPFWLTGPPPVGSVHIRSADLGEARTMCARSRREHEEAGKDASMLAVILELEVQIACEARTARGELAASAAPRHESVRYVGTARGLAGLIADIKAASVADGVLITPVVVDPRRVAVGHRVIDEVMPLLSARMMTVAVAGE